MCQLRTPCSIRPPAPPESTAPGCGRAARCLGCPVPLCARSRPASCCHTGTVRRWTPCWSHWRNGVRSGWKAPLTATGRDSWSEGRGEGEEKHQDKRVENRRTKCCCMCNSLWGFSPQKVVNHVWISLQKAHQHLILQIRRHLQQQQRLL